MSEQNGNLVQNRSSAVQHILPACGTVGFGQAGKLCGAQVILVNERLSGISEFGIH